MSVGVCTKLIHFPGQSEGRADSASEARQSREQDQSHGIREPRGICAVMQKVLPAITGEEAGRGWLVHSSCISVISVGRRGVMILSAHQLTVSPAVHTVSSIWLFGRRHTYGCSTRQNTRAQHFVSASVSQQPRPQLALQLFQQPAQVRMVLR